MPNEPIHSVRQHIKTLTEKIKNELNQVGISIINITQSSSSISSVSRANIFFNSVRMYAFIKK